MARFILAPLGSHGDVHPFVAVGRALRARGHDVHLVTAEPFRELAERTGFAGFAPVGSAEQFETLIRHPDFWHPSRSMQVLWGNRDWVAALLRDGYRAVAERYVPGNTVVLAGMLAFGARVAHDKLGVPLATVHLQPGVFPSVADPPVFATLRMRPWWPTWSRRLLYWVGDRFVVDPLVAPPLNAFRAELGLPPVRRVIGRWVHSPQMTLNLFPAWYGHAPDWPPQTVQTGFVRYDQADAPLPEAVNAFLSAGDPPVVVTFGSAMRQGAPYFAAAADACRRLGRRALFLCKGREQLPADLPADALHADYAPFSVVFPRAAAVVHHGGIGTSAQALAAGAPQLVMPFAFDQPDNAARLGRLGVARTVWPGRFTGPTAAAALDELLTSDGVRRACRAAAGRLKGDDPLPATCDAVERLLKREEEKRRGGEGETKPGGG